ncbi:class I SAM-dependent methyltransferase [Sneathiella sp.]|uniref:class I SAM-dependent methyltransferase n=1 Tax=Sneathiella sp. TaxID=1964365 RepID=UPI002FE210F9
MTDRNSRIHSDVATYYSRKLEEFGTTAKGVDWKDREGQFLRFAELSRLILDAPQTKNRFSITDYGCGYGAFLEFLQQRFPPETAFEFLGLDLSDAMVKAARARFADEPRARFIQGAEPDVATDFAVASGIFNVSLGTDPDEWLAYILRTLDIMAQHSTQGFAFNCLTSYSDEDRKADHLYYADPCFLFDHCKRTYSRNVALLHDYDLYEFTLLVRS